MQVVLRDRLENLGEAGDIVDVAPGYARKYLIPKGLAYAVTNANARRIEAEKAAQMRREADTLKWARHRASMIEGVTLTFYLRADEEGQLYGSITSTDIADRLAEQGIKIDRRSIELDEPIKSLGVTSVPVRLDSGVCPEMKVWVLADDYESDLPKVPVREDKETLRPAMEASLLRRVEDMMRASLSRMSEADVIRAIEAPTPAATVAEIISAAPDVGLPTESAWTRALVRGAARKQDLIARAGGCFSSGQVADLLGISVSAVNQRKNKHKSILAVPLSGGQWGFPVRQFVDGDVRSGVADVVRAAGDMNPWVLLSILLEERGEEGGPVLLDSLEDPAIRTDVLQRVRSHGEHVAA